MGRKTRTWWKEGVGSLRRAWAASALLVALPALAACGGEAEGAGDVVVRDSAGIAIVENAADAAVPAWTVASEPTVEIGGQMGDPDQELFRVRSALRLPGGSIAIVNGGTQEIRFYGPDGSFVRAAGGEGEGPGEFQNPSFLDRLGPDSLLVYDFGDRSVSVLDREGAYARSFRLELGAEESGFPSPQAVTGPEGRRLLVREGRIFRAGQLESGVTRNPITYHLMDAEGKLVRTLGDYQGSESWVLSNENMVMVRSLPFARSPQLAGTDSGFYFGSTDRYEIDYYDLEGNLRRKIRVVRDPRLVTDAEIEAYRSDALTGVDDDRRPELERTLRETPYPESMPAHGALEMDALGHLWVKEYRPSFEEGPDVWWIYDPEGRRVATAELPRGTTVHQIGEDFILGEWQDELDLERVRIFRLERAG